MQDKVLFAEGEMKVTEGDIRIYVEIVMQVSARQENGIMDHTVE
jgi:hypothetical protein